MIPHASSDPFLPQHSQIFLSRHKAKMRLGVGTDLSTLNSQDRIISSGK